MPIMDVTVRPIGKSAGESENSMEYFQMAI